MWILGDSFASASMEPYFKTKSLEKYGGGYIRENFDVLGKLSNKYLSNDPNLISRLHNQLVDAIHEKVILPKYLVVVLDDDLIKFLNLEPREGVAKAMGRVINEIMSDHRKLLQRQKEYLNKRSKKYMFPQIVWIEAPYHKNFGRTNNSLRKIYNQCLDKVASFNTDVTILELKKIWESDNSRLFIEESSRYTTEGFANYWAAVDCTLKFMDTIYIQKILTKTAKKDKKKNKGKQSAGRNGESQSQSQNRYKWESGAYKKSRK